MKKFFALVCTVLIAFILAIIGFAHPGGTDGKGGHYDRSTGEYHYHHGYSAHQHEDGECPYASNEFTFPYACIEVENLEDVLRNEFEDEYAEEIRDAIVYTSDTELFEIYSTYYVEYESLRNTTMNQYGENITERIFSNPDLIVLTPEDFADKFGKEECDETLENNITEYTEEYEHEEKEEKSSLEQVIDGVIDFAKELGVYFAIIFLIYALFCIVEHFKDIYYTKKRK